MAARDDTRTFLATPRRGRVLVAKELSILVVAPVLAVLGLAVALAVAVPWLLVEGSSFELSGDTVAYAGRVVAATTLWGALGVAVGAVVLSQAAALVGAILWVLVGEALLTVLLGLVGLEAVGKLLPGRALSAFGGTEPGLSMWLAGAVGAGWVVALALLGHLRISRQDVT
ncbi:MAG: hypothetical protein RMM28_11470 [Thermoleophilia bacterium]|nr:hypothetical protein [Thermoleophilia bacterium]